jgi:selenocysteine-specific elongation factor
VFVVATAGHVDHGKSTLIRALTGMEPDRWAEERRRGMTIDLGYAWMSLPSGDDLAFVDVPGHQRFIANMLAGLGPAPAVLFVVAADGGWSRQSTEHLAAISALDVRHGLLAVTRSDLADPGPARDEALRRLADSSLGAVESVMVSGHTGAGLPELRDGLDRLVRRLPEPDPAAPVRLWIDRAFTVRGSGTVVTGTLSAGSITVGDEFELHDRLVRVRSIQTMGRPCDTITATARVALNLRRLDRAAVGRGDVLLTAGVWHRTDTLDVRMDGETRLPEQLMLHVGSAGIPVRIRPLGAALARLTLAHPVPLRAGDRAVLRDPGQQSVAAGVLILDADPPRLMRRGDAARRAEALAGAGGRPDPLVEVNRRGAVRRSHLASLGIAIVDAMVEPGAVHVVDDWLVTPPTWQAWVDAIPSALNDWATRSPLDPAMPPAALGRALGIPDAALLAAVLRAAGVRVVDGRIRPPEASGSLGPAEDGVRTLERRLRDNPFAAPDAHELTALRLGRRELAAAAKAGRLLRLDDDIVLLPNVAEPASDALRPLPQPFTASAARTAFATTRRVALPLLEHLDAMGVTERVDDQLRRLRQ